MDKRVNSLFVRIINCSKGFIGNQNRYREKIELNLPAPLPEVALMGHGPYYRWQLLQDNIELGTLYQYDENFPWVLCLFIPTQEYEEIRLIFTAFHNLSQQIPEKDYEWEQVRQQILELKLKLRSLEKPTFVRGDKVLLQIDEKRAMFRVSSSPNVFYSIEK